MRICRRRAAPDGRGESHRRRIAFRLGLFGAIAVFALAFGSEASAQCTGGRIGGGGGGPCTIDPATGNTGAAGQAAVIDLGTQFLQRANALATFRNAASAANNPQGGGADGAEPRYRTWLEGYGMQSHTDARDTFTGDRRKAAGVTAGAGATIVPGVNVGLSLDQSRTEIDITGAPQSGRIDLTQVGALASFEHGPWSLGATFVHGFGRVHTSRFDGSGEATASYDARLWGAMTELSYYYALPNNSRIVPKLAFDWMRSRTDAFTEVGGATPVAGSAVTANRIRMLIGGEIGHSWLADRTVMDFLVYAKLVDNLEQNFGALLVSDPNGVDLPQFVAGVKESVLGADAGATLSAKLTDAIRVYAVYDGRFRSNFISHTGTVGAEFRF